PPGACGLELRVEVRSTGRRCAATRTVWQAAEGGITRGCDDGWDLPARPAPYNGPSSKTPCPWTAGACEAPMAEPTRPDPPAAKGVERDVLLATKLHVPRPRPQFLSRPRLLQRLAEGTAPPADPAGGAAPRGRGGPHG